MTCEDVIIINQGQVAVSSSLEDLTKQGSDRTRLYLQLLHPGEDTAKLLHETPNVADVARGDEPGSYRITSDPETDPSADIGMLVLQHNWGLKELRQERPSLEEIFIRLTTE